MLEAARAGQIDSFLCSMLGAWLASLALLIQSSSQVAHGECVVRSDKLLILTEEG